MSETDCKSPGLGKTSLMVALPLVAMALAMGMSLIYLTASIGAARLHGKAESKAQAERIAHLLAPDLAEGHDAGIQNTLSAFAPAYLEIRLDGNTAYSSASESGEEIRHSLPIVHDGVRIGELRATSLADGQIIMPTWGVGGLFILSVSLAFALSYYFAGRVTYAVNAVRQDANDLRNRQVKSDPNRTASSFTELRQLDIAMRRAMGSVRREADELRKTAFSNPHNGLPNYAALTRYLDQHLKTTDFGHPLALYRLDLDHFDRACESFGSDVGEALLREAVARIRRELNDLTERGLIECSGYFLAQIWADNLFLVLPNIGGRGDASAVARALRSAFVAPVKMGNYDITLGLSGGIVMAPEDGTLRTDLLRRSETALRAVREDGKRGFRFYAPRLDRVATGRAQLETEMREGIEKGEFVPYFQPKIDLRSGRILGCEALARWQRPEGRFISPAAFIPVAEETGLIEKIGRQILFASCQQAANWLRDGLPMTIAVNVSPLELRNPGFRNQVLSALTETGLPPSYLELEITESVAVEDPKAFREMFNPLKAMGVRLAVDDFGTGHSNLATLSQLQFDVFKIDRQFVHSLGQESSSQPIVEMILAMADSIGMETVAEGVETPEQARFLRERGCTFAQGFVYSKALEGREYADFARSWEARRRQRATRMSA